MLIADCAQARMDGKSMTPQSAVLLAVPKRI